jgi:hypothetical protein
MRSSLSILFSYLLAFTVNAECYYSDYILKLEIGTGTGTVTGYQRVSACDYHPDSVFSDEQLLTLLLAGRSPDSLGLFRERVTYSYCIAEVLDCMASEKESVEELLNLELWNTQYVARVTVVEHMLVPVFDHISTSFTLADTTWMKKRPVRVLHASAYLCYHNIFVYEADAQVSAILAEIETFEAKVSKLEEERSMRADIGDPLDEELLALVQQMPPEKRIVVVSGCTD